MDREFEDFVDSLVAEMLAILNQADIAPNIDMLAGNRRMSYNDPVRRPWEAAKTD